MVFRYMLSHSTNAAINKHKYVILRGECSSVLHRFKLNVLFNGIARFNISLVLAIFTSVEPQYFHSEKILNSVMP